MSYCPPKINRSFEKGSPKWKHCSESTPTIPACQSSVFLVRVRFRFSPVLSCLLFLWRAVAATPWENPAPLRLFWPLLPAALLTKRQPCQQQLASRLLRTPAQYPAAAAVSHFRSAPRFHRGWHWIPRRALCLEHRRQPLLWRTTWSRSPTQPVPPRRP